MSSKISVALLVSFSLIAVGRGTVAAPAIPPGWFVFAPKSTSEPGAVGLADWLDAPAGRHGAVEMQRDRLMFADGTGIKLWGVNNFNLGVAPDRQEARLRAAWYAKYGVNVVRLHKFGWKTNGMNEDALGSAETGTQLVPALLDRMDYYVAELKSRGIYITWSHIFGMRVQPGDRSRLLAYGEVLEAWPDKSYFLAGSTYGVVNLFEDLQDLNIELTTNLLNHRNEFTGVRYADEAALAMIELQNEDNAWWSAGETLRRMPTYRAKLAAMFCDWLRAKYGTEDRLLAAWGQRGLDLWPDEQTGERLETNNIYPPPDRQYYQPEALARSPSRQRLLDCAQFLHERQTTFYLRYAAAIRATGYKGALIGSNWRANNGVPHYYNLLADNEVGLIDRHNYFGADADRMPVGKPFGTIASMLCRSDLGLLRVGMDQVMNRPFVISEWTSVVPNEWVAEGPPVIAYYGLGLQGWDASFHFSSSHSGFANNLESPNVYNTNSPAQAGLFPLLARAVYRGDVREGLPVLPRRQLSLENLHRGKIGFLEDTDEAHDAEVEHSVSVPLDALAVGKVELEFTDQPQRIETPIDLSRWHVGSVTRSNTGELTHDARAGLFTVSTRATKAVVGVAGVGRHQLGDIGIKIANRFAVVIVTDAERSGDLNTTKRALVGLMARARNSGQRYNAAGDQLEALGTNPILLEGVTVELDWRRLVGAKVHVLDHDGLRSDRTLTVASDGTLRLDGVRDQAYLYEITWP